MAKGEFTPTSHSVYCLLLRHCDWRTRIYFGCAETLKNLYGGTATIKQIADALAHLRKNHMINYRRGTGRRGSYSILIHKHLNRVGSLKGFRLNAFADNSLHQPLYEWPNGGRTQHGVSTDGGWTLHGLNSDGGATEAVHHQEVQEFQTIRIIEFKKRKNKDVGLEGEPPSLPDIFDVSLDAAAGLDRDDLGVGRSVADRVATFPVEVSANSTATSPDNQTESDRLALQLFQCLKSPPKYPNSLSAWKGKFAAALKNYPVEDIAGSMEFGFEVDDFWPAKLFTAAGKDHCDYFLEKLPTILTKNLGRKQAAENAAKRKSPLKESMPNGRQTHGKNGHSKTSGNQNAVAETIERLRQRPQLADE